MPLIATNLDTGAVVADNVAVASTRAARAVGLLSRSGLDSGEALWIVPSRGVHTWGMRFAIDVLALDDRGVVVDQVSCLRPWRIRLPRRGTAGVLELPPGTLAASRTALGHRIDFTRSAERVAKPSAPDGIPTIRLVRPVDELRAALGAVDRRPKPDTAEMFPPGAALSGPEGLR